MNSVIEMTIFLDLNYTQVFSPVAHIFHKHNLNLPHQSQKIKHMNMNKEPYINGASEKQKSLLSMSYN